MIAAAMKLIEGTEAVGKSSWPWRPSYRIGINRAISTTPVCSIIGPSSMEGVILRRPALGSAEQNGLASALAIVGSATVDSSVAEKQTAAKWQQAAARWAMLTASDPAEAQQNARCWGERRRRC